MWLTIIHLSGKIVKYEKHRWKDQKGISKAGKIGLFKYTVSIHYLFT